jgi:predicted nucleotidyltransferase/HEPN domain-containing protein
MCITDEDTELKSLVDIIATKYSPEKIILFGSRARGDHKEDSDYDILILMKNIDNKKDFVTLLYSELKRCNLNAEVDFLVTSSDRYEKLKSDVGLVYIHIDREGKVLYERMTRKENFSMKASNYIIWLKRAYSNLTIAKFDYAGDDIPLEYLCYNCNKAAIFALKSFFVFFNIIPPITKDILLFAKELSKYTAVPENIFAISNLLSSYDEEITSSIELIVAKDEFVRACAAADECVTWVVSEIERKSQKQLDLRK